MYTYQGKMTMTRTGGSSASSAAWWLLVVLEAWELIISCVEVGGEVTGNRMLYAYPNTSSRGFMVARILKS
jgi:hypothetical protein